jgi:hypothetical protein
MVISKRPKKMKLNQRLHQLMDNNLKTKMTILRIDIKKKVLKISRLEREISIILQAK